MTFMGFWIPTTVSPARTSLSITALLALITQQIQSDLNVSYVYALQVWNIVCIMFVFAGLLEFAIALYVMHMNQKKKANRKKSQLGRTISIPIPEKGSNSEPISVSDREVSDYTRYWRRWKERLRRHFQTTNRHSSVDYISRYLFPAAFLIFLTVFAICVTM